MPGHRFDYALIRVVPRIERGELINAGVILHCRSLDFLGARVRLDRVRLAALFPLTGTDLDVIESALALFPRLCAGDPGAGEIVRLPPPERFHWLVAPRSTVIQTSPVHSGLADDPAGTLEHLFQTMVEVTGFNQAGS
jgi:hypothetical protein